MIINKIIDDQMAAWARNDLIGMLADAGHALVQTGLKVNGARYQDVLVGPLMVKAAAALEECWKREGLIQDAAKPENPDDVVVKVTVPDRWPMTEAGQRRAAQEAAWAVFGDSYRYRAQYNEYKRQRMEQERHTEKPERRSDNVRAKEDS